MFWSAFATVRCGVIHACALTRLPTASKRTAHEPDGEPPSGLIGRLVTRWRPPTANRAVGTSLMEGRHWKMCKVRVGIVKLSRFGRDGVQRARLHAAAVAQRHCAAASDRKIRRVERETRCRCRLNVLWTAACMLRKRWAEPGDLKHCSLRSRLRTTWCEFSARLFCRKPCSW